MPIWFRKDAMLLLAALVAGCSYSGEKQADARRAAAESYKAGLTAFDSKDYATAEKSFATAIDLGGLNPDLMVDASIKRAVCWGSGGKTTEAIAELQKIETWGADPDAVYAARSYVLAKQGKAAESRAALAKARQLNRTVSEFKD
jgi:outer membrane protein assembly factor BamD (BamD/ComL family)